MIGMLETKQDLSQDEFLDDPEVKDFIEHTRELLNSEPPAGAGTDSGVLTNHGASIAQSQAGRPAASSSPAAATTAGMSRAGGVITSSAAPLHAYRHSKPAYDWSCSSLLDAAAGYRFPIKNNKNNSNHQTASRWAGYDSLRANAFVLSALQNELRSAFQKNDHIRTGDIAKAIQTWGGTEKGNIDEIDRLNSGQPRFCDYLRLCQASFGHGSSVRLGHFAGTPYSLRSNAGFTKIYSLLFDDFAIYDSRVAAALGKLIVRYALETRKHVLPRALADMVWMEDRTGRLRNPSHGPYSFPRLQHGKHAAHLRSNMKANWLLKGLVAKTRFEYVVRTHAYFMPVAPLRALEAALFMIGYDLAGNPPYP